MSEHFAVVQSLTSEQRNQFKDVSELVKSLSERVDVAQSLLNGLRSKHLNCVLRTPMLKSSWLSTPSLTTFIKLETEQVTGSFKARGALCFCHDAVTNGAESIIAASTGNHAMGIVNALSIFDCKGTIFLPTTCLSNKIRTLESAIRNTNINLVFKGEDCAETELAALQASQSTNTEDKGGIDNTKKVVYASPYNDFSVMSGTGTIATEILDDLSKLIPPDKLSETKCTCYVTVGGGGLISGIAAKLKTTDIGKWRVVGCLPQNSPVMFESLKHGSAVDFESLPTLSDGSAGGIEPGSKTLEICAHLVDAWVTVSENEIGNAMARVFTEQRKVLEGAAGVAVAGFLRDGSWRKQNDCSIAVIVACGSNVEVDCFMKVISGKYDYKE